MSEFIKKILPTDFNSLLLARTEHFSALHIFCITQERHHGSCSSCVQGKLKMEKHPKSAEVLEINGKG